MSWEFGLAMEGCGEAIKQALLGADASTWRRGDMGMPFHYVELGIAEGKTLGGVHRFLQFANIRCRVTGVDIADGWSLKMERVAQNAPGASVLLCGSQDYLLHVAAPLQEMIDFLLIDACHARDCCKADFLAAADLIRPGGIVCFHDTCPESQGSEVQPHCGQPIGVRAAVRELGLLDGARPGWTVWRETPYLPGKDSRGMLFVQKAT